MGGLLQPFDDSGGIVLNELKSLDVRFREVIEKGIHDVQSGGHKSMDDRLGCLFSQIFPDFGNISKLEIAGSNDAVYVCLHGEGRVQHGTDVPDC